MSRDQACVLKILISEDPTTFVLVHVSRIGKAALDLKLIATEGESPYVGILKQSHLKNLRHKNYQGSDKEFEQILTSTLGQCLPSIAPDGVRNTDLEVGASIRGSGDDNKEIVITVRKRIDTITQRVASLTLKQDDNQTIELFEWTSLTISKANSLGLQISSLTDTLRAAENTIAKLDSQLKELVEAKSDHENRLMTSFVQVLNEKKLQIRNQQRLLASAHVDLTGISELRTTTSAREHRRAGSSRLTKRKMTNTVDGGLATDDEFQNMDNEQVNDYEDELAGDESRETPQPLEDGIETDEEDDIMSDSPHQSHRTGEKGVQEVKPDADRLELMSPGSPPPRRNLPFTTRKTVTSDPIENDHGLDCETDDDEL